MGFVLMELPWNAELASMDPAHVAANLLCLAVPGAIVFLAGQRTRAAAAAFAGACLLVGIANAFVIQFKGQPIVPADLLALGTAASVSSGYSFWPTLPMAGSAALFALYCTALALAPRGSRLQEPRAQARARRACNAAAALLVAAAGAGLYGATDVQQRYGCTVDAWDVRGSYARQGTALCFLERTQQLVPAAPEGYSRAVAEELRAAGAQAARGALGQAVAQASFDPAGEGQPLARPHVIAIMNETFSDLSAYPGLEGSSLEPTLVNGLAASSAIGGTAAVSALGGGTCNSEFEFLTGTSLGNLGGGVYPYMLYDLKQAESLPRAFRALGYGTRAIHPAEGGNWRRSAVYGQLGFDTFDDIGTFKADPAYEEGLFRNLVSDRATYELALAMIDEATSPQFVFDVTIQNHGGYDPPLVPGGERVAVDRPGLSDPELEEFASCLAASERDLAYLLGELERREEPVVVCFFGDHQPGFADRLFERTFGTGVEGVPLWQVQQRFSTPYLLWGNRAARSLGLADPTEVEGGPTSLNYLGSTLLRACKLPSGDYFAFLQALQGIVPAINMNGYLAADGQWRWFDQDGGVGDALWAYAAVQHASLFG